MQAEPAASSVSEIAKPEANMAQTATGETTAESQAQGTRDHETIRCWADARGGHPAVVEGTEILRIDFDEPDDRDERLRRVSWDDFFRIFDARDLQFLYQEKTRNGKTSRFNKFVGAGSNEQDR
jgi:hypothetical protein